MPGLRPDVDPRKHPEGLPDVKAKRYMEIGKGKGQIKQLSTLSEHEIEDILRDKKFIDNLAKYAPEEAFLPSGLIDKNFVVKLCGLGQKGYASEQRGGFRGGVFKSGMRAGQHEVIVHRSIETKEIVDKSDNTPIYVVNIPTGKIDKRGIKQMDRKRFYDENEAKQEALSQGYKNGIKRTTLWDDTKDRGMLESIREFVPCMVIERKSKSRLGNPYPTEWDIISPDQLAKDQKVLTDINEKDSDKIMKSRWRERRMKIKGSGKILGSRLLTKSGELVQASPTGRLSKLEWAAKVVAQSGGGYESIQDNPKWQSLWDAYRAAQSGPDVEAATLNEASLKKLAQYIDKMKPKGTAEIRQKKRLVTQYSEWANKEVDVGKGNPIATSHSTTYATGYGYKGAYARADIVKQGPNESLEAFELRQKMAKEHRQSRVTPIPGFDERVIGTIDTCMRCGGNVGYDKQGTKLSNAWLMKSDAQIFPIEDLKHINKDGYPVSFGNVSIGGRPKRHIIQADFFSDERKGPDLHEWNRKKKMPQLSPKRASMQIYCNACEKQMGYLETVPAPEAKYHPRFGKIEKGEALWSWTAKLLGDHKQQQISAREEEHSARGLRRKKGQAGVHACGQCGADPTMEPGFIATGRKKHFGSTYPDEKKSGGIRPKQYSLGVGKSQQNLCWSCLISVGSTGEPLERDVRKSDRSDKTTRVRKTLHGQDTRKFMHKSRWT